MAVEVQEKPEVSQPSDAAPKTGRPSAGQDPAKRQQIIDGAKRIFMQVGFEAASMNDITAEAGVSKGTLYVYFENKEDLFLQLINRERSRMFATVRDILDESQPVAEALHRFGFQVTTRMTSPEVIRAQRTVLGVAERMPHLAARFMVGDSQYGFESGATILSRYLDRQVAEGVLAIEDTDLAARQFTDLSMAGIFRTCLFGYLDQTPTPEAINRNVASAVEIFLLRYSVAEQARRGDAR